jgi:hypothetical protein
MAVIAGYTGLYRQPYPNGSTYGSTMYAITDKLHQELDLLLLTPGCYSEAYALCSGVTYQRIHIFVPCMDALFLSDVFRLVTDLMKRKLSVQWHFPGKVTTSPGNVLFDMAQVKGGNFASDLIEDLTIEFKRSISGDDDHPYYDFYVCDGESYVVFCMEMDAEKLTTLMTGEYDEVHLPYNTTFYGGLTGRECIALNEKWAYKLIPNNFKSREEFIEATEGPMGHARRLR